MVFPFEMVRIVSITLDMLKKWDYSYYVTY
jgi:hypothetical protein